MSAFTQFLGNLAGQVAARAIIPRILNSTGGLGRMEPGRYPHPEYGPIIVPRGAQFDQEQPGEKRYFPPGPRFQIASWAVFAAYGGLLWYAARKTTPPPLVDLPDQALGQSLSKPEEQALFPGLKRELQPFKIEDVATSDDPVEACLERAGWKLDRVDELRQSIFEKQQLDMFNQPQGELSRSEEELLEAINTCLEFLEGKFGSLEAAGVGCSVCDGDDPDLGIVQREMFDPEQAEIDFDPAPDPRTIPRDRIEFLLNQYLEGLETGQQPTIDGATLHIYGRTGKEYKEALLGKLRSWGFKNWTSFKATMKRQRRYATGEAPRLYEYLDNLEPAEPANVLDACNSIMATGKCTSEQIDSLIELVKQEGYFYIDDLRKAYKSGGKEKIPAHRKTRKT